MAPVFILQCKNLILKFFSYFTLQFVFHKTKVDQFYEKLKAFYWIFCGGWWYFGGLPREWVKLIFFKDWICSCGLIFSASCIFDSLGSDRKCYNEYYLKSFRKILFFWNFASSRACCMWKMFDFKKKNIFLFVESFLSCIVCVLGIIIYINSSLFTPKKLSS